MFLSVLATICAFYTIEAAVCVATYKYLKEEQRNEEIQRKKFEGLTEKLTNLNNSISRVDDYRTAQQMLRDEVKRRHELEQALNSLHMNYIANIIDKDEVEKRAKDILDYRRTLK